MRIADYIVDFLYNSGIEHIFMVTGRGILFLTDAVAKKSEVVSIPTYHEQGASFAAMAYVRASRKPAVCLVSTGCAATNAITAALCAWQDNLPVIFISGNNMLEETSEYTGLKIRTYGSQEANIVEMVKSITKYAVMLKDASSLQYELSKALYLAKSERPGPVWIDVSLDVQNLRLNIDKPNFDNLYANTLLNTSISMTRMAQDAAVTLKAFANARRPLLLIGGGGHSAKGEIEEFVNRTGIPVVFTPTACDVYGSANSLSIGAVGSIGGSRTGNFALSNADFVLVLGSKLSSQITGQNRKYFALKAKLFIVDIDPVEHMKNGITYQKFVKADIRQFLPVLSKKDLPMVDKSWQDKCLHWKQIFHPKNEDFVKATIKDNKIELYSFAVSLNRHLAPTATVITDAGFEELIIPSHLEFSKGQRCLFPASQGAMGYAIPAIIGAYYAGRNNIVAVVGDGSIMMNVQELQIISSHQIPAIIFVIQNGMYAVIRKRQKDLFRKRTIGTDACNGVPEPDFIKIANAFAFEYKKISAYDQLEESLEKIFRMERSCPLLCVVETVSDQKYFHQSYGRNNAGRLEMRPLFDLSPFLLREIIEAEMLK